MKTAVKTPDWSVIAAPGAELGQIQRKELLRLLSLVRHVEMLSKRGAVTIVHHCGGPEAMADADPDLHAAASDARSAHKNAMVLRQRIERLLAGQE